MRHRRSASAPVGVKTRNGKTSSTLLVPVLPRRPDTTRTSCGARGSRRSEMNGAGTSVDYFLEISIHRPGLFLWRLEGRRLQVVDNNDYGIFMEGIAYIILKITSGKMSFLHFWCGSQATQSDITMAHDLAHELDSTIGHAGIFSRETQGHESIGFMRLFHEGLIYIEGGPHVTLSRTALYIKRLYVITGRKHVRASCTTPMRSAVDTSSCVLLDGYPRMYVWLGEKCGYIAKVKAMRIAHRIWKYQRNEKAHIVVIDESNEELNKSFLAKLEINPEESPSHLLCVSSNHSSLNDKCVHMPMRRRTEHLNGQHITFKPASNATLCAEQQINGRSNWTFNEANRRIVNGGTNSRLNKYIQTIVKDEGANSTFNEFNQTIFNGGDNSTLNEANQTLGNGGTKSTVTEANKTIVNVETNSPLNESYQCTLNGKTNSPLNETNQINLNGGTHSILIESHHRIFNGGISSTLNEAEQIISTEGELLTLNKHQIALNGETNSTSNEVNHVNLNEDENSTNKGQSSSVDEGQSDRSSETFVTLSRGQDVTLIKGDHLTLINAGSTDCTTLNNEHSYLNKATVSMFDCACAGLEYKDAVTLHRISGDSAMYDMPFAARKPLDRKCLIPTSSYILVTDSMTTVYLWVGARTPDADCSRAISRLETFCSNQNRPLQFPMCRVLEGCEPEEFKQAFNDWRNISVGKTFKQGKKYSPRNTGRGTYAETSKREASKRSVSFSEVHEREDYIELEVYVRREDDTLDFIERSEYGHFSNGKCYIVNCQRGSTRRSHRTLYYWIGEKCNVPDKVAFGLAMSMAESFGGDVSMARVLDGDEPVDFMDVFGNSILILDKHEADDSPVKMFSVKETIKGNIRVTQVAVTCNSLNTSATFIVISDAACFVWYGRNSGSVEREYAKQMPGYLQQMPGYMKKIPDYLQQMPGYLHPHRLHNYDILTEGRESEMFWKLIGGKTDGGTEYKFKRLVERQPRLFYCDIHRNHLTFEEMVDFEKEDLSEEALILCDTFDQIFVWYGSSLDSTLRNNFYDIIKEYISRDQAGRRVDDLHLCYLCQGHESRNFIEMFKTWNSDDFGGQDAYERCRKSIRRQNAQVDLDEIFDKCYLSKKKYPYKTLLKRTHLPDDVDPANKQFHLTDKHFQEVVKLSRFQFYQLPEWKQKQILKMTRLSSGCVNRHSFIQEKVVPTLTLPEET